LGTELSFDTLQKFFSEEEFVLGTIQQIHKDLSGLVALDHDLKVDFTADIYPQLEAHLQELFLKMNDQLIQQFVYKVDLKEYDFLNALSAQDDYRKLCFLIIQREAQKVYFKRQYS